MKIGGNSTSASQYNHSPTAGQPGVERVLGMLRNETRTTMQQIGAPSLKDLTPAMVKRV